MTNRTTGMMEMGWALGEVYDSNGSFANEGRCVDPFATSATSTTSTFEWTMSLNTL